MNYIVLLHLNLESYSYVLILQQQTGIAASLVLIEYQKFQEFATNKEPYSIVETDKLCILFIIFFS